MGRRLRTPLSQPIDDTTLPQEWGLYRLLNAQTAIESEANECQAHGLLFIFFITKFSPKVSRCRTK
ncbi:MAG: hypothetical protein Q9P01_07595 [Anaerolineae bacterium]|nr:hypothetical protein [Anaerolineae bacterium]